MGTEQKEDGDSLAGRRVRYVEKKKELGKKPVHAEVGGVQTRDRERGWRQGTGSSTETDKKEKDRDRWQTKD